jgi:hypothetical protein
MQNRRDRGHAVLYRGYSYKGYSYGEVLLYHVTADTPVRQVVPQADGTHVPGQRSREAPSQSPSHQCCDRTPSIRVQPPFFPSPTLTPHCQPSPPSLHLSFTPLPSITAHSSSRLFPTPTMPRSQKPLCTQTQPYFTRQPAQWNLRDYVDTIHERYSTRPNPQRSIHGAWKAALERILSCRNAHKGHRERQLRATTLLKEYHQKVRLMHFCSRLAFWGADRGAVVRRLEVIYAGCQRVLTGAVFVWSQAMTSLSRSLTTQAVPRVGLRVLMWHPMATAIVPAIVTLFALLFRV